MTTLALKRNEIVLRFMLESKSWSDSVIKCEATCLLETLRKLGSVNSSVGH